DRRVCGGGRRDPPADPGATQRRGSLRLRTPGRDRRRRQSPLLSPQGAAGRRIGIGASPGTVDRLPPRKRRPRAAPLCPPDCHHGDGMTLDTRPPIDRHPKEDHARLWLILAAGGALWAIAYFGNRPLWDAAVYG